MELKDYRKRMDRIDEELVRLFQERMKVSAEIGAWKNSRGLPILDKSRENQKLSALVGTAEEGMQNYVRVLYSLLFALSRTHQSNLSVKKTPLQQEVCEAMETTPSLFPASAAVACQGMDGDRSGIACRKLFSDPFILYRSSFADVFSAVDRGECQYGVFSLEDSAAGSISDIFDLLRKYGFSIVRSVYLNLNPPLKAPNPACPLDSAQDRKHSPMRYICISRKLEIYPGADQTSIMVITDQCPGTLFELMTLFYALGIQVLRLESHTLPNRDFGCMFWFDLHTSVNTPEFLTLIGELESSTDQVRYLGTYSEVL
ncbi:MAG: chorismate mutase [Clostridia bacterium]|nr:chorismate mutase [Clostridia bacterium]